MRRAVAVLAFLFAASHASAWDVALVGSSGDCAPITPFIWDNFYWASAQPAADSGGVEGDPFEIGAIAPVPDGRILGIHKTGPTTADILSVALGAEPVKLGSFTTEPHESPTAAVADAAGNLIVLLDQSILMKVASDGTVLGRHVLLPAGSQDRIESMDLAADSCTVYLAKGSVLWSVQRFDLCTGTFGSDFLTPRAGWFSGVRLLPQGEVLVANAKTLQRYAVNGTLLQTLATPGRDDNEVDEIALTNGGRTAWVSYHCGAPTRLWNLETGALLAETDVGVAVTRSLVAANGWNVVFGTHHLGEVPTLSQTAMLLLAAVLVAVAISKLA